jgi:ubiquinone/menaquinone biosynthesis C-methylase UbiE
MGAFEEQVYHDKVAKTIDLDSLFVYETFEAATAPENRYIVHRLGDVSNKMILDLGCGAGESSVYFALKRAVVATVDVSPEMVKIGQKLADKHKVSVHWSVSDASQLPFNDETFDIVYGNSVLHHLPDIEISLCEVKRTLKTGGIAIFIEPLAHNPIINIYRWIAKEVRTKDEKPFKIKELETLFRRVFGNCHHEEFWFLTLWMFVRFYIIERANPNKERYWKKIIKEHRRLYPLYNKLEKIDSKLLSVLPFLKKYCWNTVVCAVKGSYHLPATG